MKAMRADGRTGDTTQISEKRKRGKTRGGGRYGLVWAMSIRKAQRADYRDGREQGATMTK